MTIQDLLDHEARRPELPRPVPAVDSPEWQKWRKAWGAWMAKKEAMQTALTVDPLGITFERVRPSCPPKSDYIYREPIKRRRKAA